MFCGWCVGTVTPLGAYTVDPRCVATAALHPGCRVARQLHLLGPGVSLKTHPQLSRDAHIRPACWGGGGAAWGARAGAGGST